MRTIGLNVDLQGGDGWLSVAVVFVTRVDGCENHWSECRPIMWRQLAKCCCCFRYSCGWL